jgi:hypothetical protein
MDMECSIEYQGLPVFSRPFSRDWRFSNFSGRGFIFASCRCGPIPLTFHEDKDYFDGKGPMAFNPLNNPDQSLTP